MKNELIQTEVVRERSLEPVEFIECESLEVPCENKLGFTALCAACPLVSLFGECPKEVLNTLENPVLYEPEVTGTDLVEDVGSAFEDRIQKDLIVDKISSVDSNSIGYAPQPQDKPVRVEVKKNVQPKQNTEKKPKVSQQKTEKENEKKPALSYLDLLFDDEIPVVVAAAFRLPVKERVTPAPTHQMEVRPTSPIVKEQARISAEKPVVKRIVQKKPVQVEPALRMDTHESAPVVNLHSHPKSELMPKAQPERETVRLSVSIAEPVVANVQLKPVERESINVDPELFTAIEEPPHIKEPLKKDNMDEPIGVFVQPQLPLVRLDPIIQEQVDVESESIRAVATTPPMIVEGEPIAEEGLPEEELPIIIEVTQTEQGDDWSALPEEVFDYTTTEDTVIVSCDSPETLTQNSVVPVPSLLRNIRLLLGSFVLKIAL